MTHVRLRMITLGGDQEEDEQMLVPHQRRLRAAVGGFLVREQQRVFGHHGDGSQHERHEQVQMDVVPRAVEPPARTWESAEKCVYRASRGVKPVKDVLSKHADSSRVNSWSRSRLLRSPSIPRESSVCGGTCRRVYM